MTRPFSDGGRQPPPAADGEHAADFSAPRTEQQERAYQALLLVDRLCRAYGISYFLLAGTVLGAVRHGGFIPWDDDIDIGMTPENLRRFYEVCPRRLPDGFWFSHPENNPRHPRFFGKILFEGRHCVDLFPVVPTSDKPREQKRHFYRNRFLFTLYLRKLGVPFSRKHFSVKRAGMYAVSLLLAQFYSVEAILERVQRNFRRYEGREAGWYLNICSKYRPERELIRGEWVRRLAPLVFEQGEFPAFEDARAYLRHLYGDYMTLPPERQRAAEHEDQIFDCYG